MCTSEGEIQGIGFDEDDVHNNAPRVFQLFGSQVWADGIQDFNTYTSGDMGTYILDRADTLQRQFGFVESVRGRGLMIAIELSVPGTPIVTEALAKGLRINCTQDTVLRLLPAMTITTTEVDEAFDILNQVMKETESKLVTS